MPFKSEKQRRLCWYKYNKAKKEHKKPQWDCKEWERKSDMSFGSDKIVIKSISCDVLGPKGMIS